ncbi:MAG TPA: CBS domain-containing protein [Candidatus Binatia bacterium]
MQIRELMSRYFEVVSHNSDVREAAMKMRDLNVSVLPVCDGPRLIGVVTTRDIALRLAAEGHDAMLTQAGEIMTRDLTYCYEDQDIEEAASVMESFQIDRLPVLDRNKQLVGMIGMSDIRSREGTVASVPEIAVLPDQYSAAMVGRR